MSQLFLFGSAPEVAPKQQLQVIRRNFGPAPEQPAMNLTKLLRKIQFKRRFREKKGEYDTHQYSQEGIVRVHWYMLTEWIEHFPTSTNLRDQYSYWSWMLGDPSDPFSFRDCLIANGYTRPDELIEALEVQAPAWFKEIHRLTELEQLERLKQMVADNGFQVPSPRLVYSQRFAGLLRECVTANANAMVCAA